MNIRPKFIGTVLSLVFLISLAWVFLIFDSEFSRVKNELRESQNQITLVEREKSSIREQLELTRSRLARATTGLRLALEKIKSGNEKIAVLTKSLSALFNEKMRIEAKLHSLKDLKDAIRQVKLEIRQQKLHELAARKKLQQEIDAAKLALGNRGYIVKNGVSRYRTLVKIEVRPGD